MSRDYQYETLPQACKCVDCGHVLENPQKHCIDLKCPKCGGKMRRAKSSDNKVESDVASSPKASEDLTLSVRNDSWTGWQKEKEMEEFAKRWIEQGLYDPNDFDEDGFSKQMSAEQRERIPASQFACNGEKRKLPIHDAAHTRNAMARYNQAEGCQTAEVKARICRAARKFNIESAFESGGFCAGGKKMEDNPEEPTAEPQEPEKPKTALEKYKEAIENATTQDEIDKAKEQYYEDKAWEKVHAKEIAKVQEKVEREHKQEMSELPDRIEKLEEKFDKFLEKFGEFADDTKNHFQKLDEAPAIKAPAPSEAESLVSQAEQKIKETGSLDEAHRMLTKLQRAGRLGA